MDTSRLVSVLQAAPSFEDAPLDLASVSGPEQLGERSEWARAAARRTVVAGGWGNGAVSGWQIKQHRQVRRDGSQADPVYRLPFLAQDCLFWPVSQAGDLAGVGIVLEGETGKTWLARCCMLP